MSKRKTTPIPPQSAAKLAEAHLAARRETPSVWAVAVTLAISIGLVFGCGFHGRNLRAPFVFDDAETIFGNESITSLWPLIGPAEHPGPLNPSADLPVSARPLVNLSLAMNYAIGGLNPMGYHVVNIAIHFLSSMFVWAIVRRTLLLPYFGGRFNESAGWLATAVAMLWALHPLQTETVIYVTQRTELMVTLFYLAALYCCLRYWALLPVALGESSRTGALESSRIAQLSGTWLTLAVVSCLAGMGSKEVMVSAPLIVLLFERTFIAGSLKLALRRSWPLYAGLASTWLLLVVLGLGAPHGQSAGFHLGVGVDEWWLTQQQILWMYLKLVVWPSPLLIHYQLPYLKTMSAAWMYVVPTVILIVAILVLLWQNRPLGFLGAWAFAILLPTMAVPIILEMAAERRMYLPLLTVIAPFVIGSYLLGSRLRFGSDGRRALAVAIGLLAVTFGLVSANRLVAYEDERTLWRGVLSFQPDNSLAHANLGRLLTGSNQIPVAIAELQAAVAAEPDFAIARNSLGVALTRASRHQEAAENFERAVRVDPKYADAWQNLGNALKELGHLPEAIEHIEHALRLKPNDFEAHNNLGVALAANGQTSQAIAQFRESIRLNPADAKTRVNLAKLLVETGNEDEAYSQFVQALTLQPDRADVHSCLGAILGKAGRMKEAIEHFQAALQLDPKLTDAYSNLSVALAIENRPTEAIAISQRGIEVARANGQPEAAQNAEEWLRHYRAELQTAGKPPKQ